MEDNFALLSKKGKELLENFGWIEEKENNRDWEFNSYKIDHF